MQTIEETYRERLRLLIKEHKTQAALSRAIDVAPAQISQWVNASPDQTGKPRTLSQGSARKIEKNLGLPTGWFDQPIIPIKKNEVTILGEPTTWSSRDMLPEDEYVYAPFYKDTVFLGGDGAEAEEDRNNFRLPFARATLYARGIQPNNVVCVSAEGDSMERTIADGATLGVDKGDTAIKDGKIYIFEHGGLLRFKRLFKMPHGKLRVISDNHIEYPEEIVDLNEITIYGRVFWWSVLD